MDKLRKTPEATVSRLPPWIRVRLAGHGRFEETRRTISELRLHSVCEEARCPNLSHCWGRGVATFMILGDVCTRGCRFCAVSKGKPLPPDQNEPVRVGEAAERLGLRHVVVTSVDRDDLSDGGSEIIARTTIEVRRRNPGCTVELLVPDFLGDEKAIRTVVESAPEILNHNLETVPRLYPRVRPKASYKGSLRLLQLAKELRPDIVTKTGIMVGLGETRRELVALMEDVVAHGIEILTIGQYLRPTRDHLPVARYVPPEEFDELKEIGEALGIGHVEAGPLVRSSYQADAQFDALQKHTSLRT